MRWWKATTEGLRICSSKSRDSQKSEQIAKQSLLLRKTLDSAHMWHGSHGSKDDTHKTRRECRNPFQFTWT